MEEISSEGKIEVKWQEDCDSKIRTENNVLLSSPTGSGKTGRFMKWALEKTERPIYITAPIKALSNQRWRELRAEGYNVGLETGDIKFIPEDCDIICCTQEIYDNKYCMESDATLVMDEFHYIFENSDRARAYVDSLYKSKAKNILICSATLGNIDEIRDYIDDVSGRKFFVYDNHERLTDLEYEGFMPKEEIQDALVVAFSQKKCRSIADSLYFSRLIDSSWPRPTEEQLKKIEELSVKYMITNPDLKEKSTMGVAYYFGAMLPKEKLFVEELFENRLIDTVVGTDALALGVNFPVENVVFTQLAKSVNRNSIVTSRNLFEQLAGRAGRKGYFDKGYVCFCDEFVDENGKPIEQYGYETEDLFWDLTDAPNESVSIILTPNIGDVLAGRTTSEEEAEFIVRYSTGQRVVEDEKKSIEKTIDYIKNFDVEKFIINSEFFEKYFEYEYDIMDESKCKPKVKEKIAKRKEELISLGIQQEFYENIGEVYMEEFNPRTNCQLFTDVLVGSSLERLMARYGKSFHDLLQLRKYVNALPKKYRETVDLEGLEKHINDIDFTALHIGEEGITMEEIKALTEGKENPVLLGDVMKTIEVVSAVRENRDNESQRDQSDDTGYGDSH